MPTEETLGPRKTMIVLVIVVGCFAVLWPRILSPLILGSSKDQLKPNQFDRDAGCCEVLFNSEIAILEVLNEVCNSVVHVTGKLSPYAAAECRKTVNDTCGVDIVAFLKRDQNVGKSSKQLLDMMKSSNSSCLKEHFGVPVLSLSTHPALNSWSLPESIKQERPTLRGGPGPHPAMRERGRAIPPGAPTPPSRGPIPMPAHMRPPPIPGMRPPLGSPGGPVTAPKSSMGFVMPIYTICIIVFFVYTLSKILFKRTASPYDQVSPDPQFRRRVFRDDSRTSPDKLGDIELEALRARLADTERAMQRIVGQLAARDADVQQDNQARSYTNGTILHNTGPVHIFTSEYQERVKEKTPEPKVIPDTKEASPDPKETSPQPKDVSPEPKDVSPEPKDVSSTEPKETSLEHRELTSESLVKEALESNHVDRNELLKLLEYDVKPEKSAKNLSEEFLNEARIDSSNQEDEGKKTTELLEEALIEDLPEDQEGGTVRVLGMEVSAHAADGGTWPRAEPHTHTHAAHTHKPSHKSEQVSSIFLQTEIPQQSRVLVADFAEDRDNQPAPIDSPLVVSGKMTLSLIQDEPRDTPDRDIESTVDDFTTASGMTQPVTELTEKQEDLPDDDLEAVQEEIVYEEHDLDDEANEGEALVHDEQYVVEPKLEEEAVNIEESVNEENNIDEEVKFEEEVVDDKQYLEEEAVNMEVSVNTEMDVNEKEKFEKEVVEDQQDIEEEADEEKEEVEELEEADIEKDLVHEEEFEEEIEEEVEVEEIEVEVTDSEEEDPDEHNKFTKSNNK